MLGENIPDLCHSNHQGFCKISAFQQRFHRRDHFAPKIISALRVDRHVADDSELVRARCDENHHGIPQRSAIHLQLVEAAPGESQRIDSACDDSHRRESQRLSAFRPRQSPTQFSHDRRLAGNGEVSCGISNSITSRRSHRHRRCHLRPPKIHRHRHRRHRRNRLHRRPRRRSTRCPRIRGIRNLCKPFLGAHARNHDNPMNAENHEKDDQVHHTLLRHAVPEPRVSATVRPVPLYSPRVAAIIAFTAAVNPPAKSPA